ncbi:MAG: hypothetical protein KDE27_02385, partial [Planctomycetes bacterium]|nr:hypothetical protein [Planctomycetota bacterium]
MRPPDDPTADSEPPARRRRLRLAHVLALLTAPGFASAIAAHLPFRHWLIDLPAGFPVQAGAALLLGTVALLATRRFRLAVVWLAGALLAAAAVLPGWLAAPA